MDNAGLIGSLGCLGVLAVIVGGMFLLVVLFLAFEYAGSKNQPTEDDYWAGWYLMYPNDPIWPRDPFSHRR